MRIEPGARCTVSEWHPHYAGLTGIVGEMMDEMMVIVRIDECAHYPKGSWAILPIDQLDEQP